jgi:hypothetical protein
VDVLMVQVWAVSTAFEVDAPPAHAGADWMCLVLAVDAPTTHGGTASMALKVDAPKISAGADFKVLAVDAPTIFSCACSLFDHTVQGALSPPHSSRRWDRQLRDKLETGIRGLHKTTLRTRGTFGEPI